MEGRAFASIASYLFLSSSIFGIRTNAGTWVSIQWANVKIIQSQLAGLVGIIFVALGTWLTQTLGSSLRRSFSWKFSSPSFPQKQLVHDRFINPITGDMAPEMWHLRCPYEARLPLSKGKSTINQ
jgi:hypothetical protein